MKRRQFLGRFVLSAVLSEAILQRRGFANATSTHASIPPQTILKPKRLQPGDTVGLIAPAGIVDREDVENGIQSLQKLGLRVQVGKHVLDRYGYLAGSDRNRAADFNRMVDDTNVKAIVAMRGGWGCNRILPFLNYLQLRRQPKIILGYSDITALLLAIHARSRIVTFHGPVATSTWNPFSVEYIRRILFDVEAATMENSPSFQGQVQVITPGTAKGILIGGNLSVLCAMLGSPYLPGWNRQILFLEDIGEDVYRVDRMLSQLKNAGILARLSGLIFGQCTNCKSEDEPTFPLQQVLQDYIAPLGIPAWYGSMIGHIPNKFTLPLGLEVEINATTGLIKMLEPAVT